MNRTGALSTACCSWQPRLPEGWLVQVQVHDLDLNSPVDQVSCLQAACMSDTLRAAAYPGPLQAWQCFLPSSCS